MVGRKIVRKGMKGSVFKEQGLRNRAEHCVQALVQGENSARVDPVDVERLPGIQLIGRHARIVGDSGTLGAIKQSADEVAAGVVVYANRHRMKLTFDVTHLNGAPIRDSALSIQPGDEGWLYRTQFQWKF